MNKIYVVEYFVGKYEGFGYDKFLAFFDNKDKANIFANENKGKITEITLNDNNIMWVG